MSDVSAVAHVIELAVAPVFLLVGTAMTLRTTTALLVCTVIAVLFLSAFVRFDTSIPIAVLFIAAVTRFFFG